MVGGSWLRTLAAAIIVVCVAGLVVALALSGRLANPSYWSFPGHPYPPSGYYINPFNAQNQGDLINAAEAGQVKADLLRDGQVELQALEEGNAALLAGSDTARSFQRESEIIASNTSKGLRERFANHVEATSVGFLADPNDPQIRWCVQEQGTTTVTMFRAADGSVASEQRFTFDGKFWLQRINGHYLITDALVSSKQ